MKKLLYVAPHLSTGGMPQYLLKQIDEFSLYFDIHVVEYSNVSSDYIVQRNKIKDSKGVTLWSLEDNKTKLLDIIEQQKPDTIYFQEIPETFVDKSILNKIFVQSRTYDLIVTTHSSYTDPSKLVYIPDKFILVCKWSYDKFRSYFDSSVECSIWKIPIIAQNYDKDKAKEDLMFFKDYKHVLHVGLFTDGKNQGHIFDIARRLEKYNVLFHFVGNQAMNFEFYWGPLMKDKPNNCIYWGEREDVERFYMASDCFIFPSKWELNPISVIEALSYGLPVYATKLDAYSDQYDGIVNYISLNDGQNAEILKNDLKLKVKQESNQSPEDTLLVTSRNPNLTNTTYSVNFADGPYIEINSSDPDSEFLVEMKDEDAGTVYYSSTVKGGSWVKSYLKYFINWNISVYKQGTLVYEHRYSAKDKRVMICIESKSLGDNIAWVSYAEEFRKKHECKVVLSSFFNSLIKDNYPEIEFIEPGDSASNLYAIYRIGWFYNEEEVDYTRLPIDPKTHPLQETATSILGLEYNEVIPRINTYRNAVRNFETYDQHWLESISKEIFDDKEYEYKSMKINPNDIVVDAGANIGIFTAYALSKGASKVYSLEPIKSYADMLSRNVAKWEDKVEVINKAISNVHGKLSILKGSDDNTILEDVFNDNNWDKEYNNVEIIDCTTLELFLNNNNLDYINFLKLDIEGSEYRVVKALSSRVLSKIEKIAIEYHWSYNDDKDEIVKKLSNNNFQVVEFETNSINKVGKIFAVNTKFKYTKNKQQVSIGMHSTAQAKYWNNLDGWQTVVDYLINKGYEVKILSKEGNGYMGNYHPVGATALPAGDISSVVKELEKSELYIGLGSGLSWLSWASLTKTVLISGFSDKNTEFETNCIRVGAPEDKCTGCFNKYKLDASDWNWCPEYKGTDKQFECTKSITPQMVIDAIDL